MKTAIETVQEMTKQQPNAATTPALDYHEAERRALATGRSVVEVQEEYRQRQKPAAPLRAALEEREKATRAAAVADEQIAAAEAEQLEYERLISTRNSIAAELCRGESQLEDSRAVLTADSSGFGQETD